MKYNKIKPRGLFELSFIEYTLNLPQGDNFNISFTCNDFVLSTCHGNQTCHDVHHLQYCFCMPIPYFKDVKTQNCSN